MKARTLPARFTALVGVIASVILSIPLAAQTASVEQTLLQLERDWEQANAKNDSASLERILAPEFVSTDLDGRQSTRAEVFAQLRSGQVKFASFVQDDYKVRVIGDTAIVTGRATSQMTRDGKDVSGRQHFTDVFVRRNGRWQAVATQSTRIAAQ